MILNFLDFVIFDDEIHETASPLSLKRQTWGSGVIEVALSRDGIDFSQFRHDDEIDETASPLFLKRHGLFTDDLRFRHFALMKPLPHRAYPLPRALSRADFAGNVGFRCRSCQW